MNEYKLPLPGHPRFSRGHDGRIYFMVDIRETLDCAEGKIERHCVALDELSALQKENAACVARCWYYGEMLRLEEQCSGKYRNLVRCGPLAPLVGWQTMKFLVTVSKEWTEPGEVTVKAAVKENNGHLDRSKRSAQSRRPRRVR